MIRLPSYWSVHPRKHGERLDPQNGLGELSGSSPHARGTLCSRRMDKVCYQVHPRMRGERSAPAEWTRFVTRFIPACAGNIEPKWALFPNQWTICRGSGLAGGSDDSDMGQAIIAHGGSA